MTTSISAPGTTVPAEVLYAAALRGAAVALLDHRDRPTPLPVRRWALGTGGDRRLVGACVGTTLDVGCGPGRMTHALTEAGHVAVGIDISREAVRLARARGAVALRRNVFDAVPRSGRWGTVLLADGNIGIGGEPVALLERVHELLDEQGRVVLDLAPPGVHTGVGTYRLAGAGMVSEPFTWATVAADTVETLAWQAGFTVVEVDGARGRWFASLVKQVRRAA